MAQFFRRGSSLITGMVALEHRIMQEQIQVKRVRLFFRFSGFPSRTTTLIPYAKPRLPANAPSTRKGHAGIRKPLKRQRLRSLRSGSSGHPWPPDLRLCKGFGKLSYDGNPMKTSKIVGPSLIILYPFYFTTYKEWPLKKTKDRKALYFRLLNDYLLAIF